MDVKTRSAMLDHVSAATPLNIYTHVTDEMQPEAVRITLGLGNEAEETEPPDGPLMTDFQPVKGRVRRPSTGCITEINDHLFEGRCSPTWPDGKLHARNVYAKTRAKCEEKLDALIREVQAERKLLLNQMRGSHPAGKPHQKAETDMRIYDVPPQRDQPERHCQRSWDEPAHGGQTL